MLPPPRLSQWERTCDAQHRRDKAGMYGSRTYSADPGTQRIGRKTPPPHPRRQCLYSVAMRTAQLPRHPTSVWCDIPLQYRSVLVLSLTYPQGVSPHLKRDFSDLSGYLRPTDERNAGYKNVNALLLCWQGDSPAKDSLLRVRQIFESNYGFRTQAFEIPVTKNPSVMLASPLAAFLREANHDQLHIIYYKGYGSYDSSGRQYWAPFAQYDSCKLNWAVIYYLVEFAQSDILFLLDTCFVPETMPSSHGLRQVISAGQKTAPDSSHFTDRLIQALHELHSGSTFLTKQLFARMTAIANAKTFMMRGDTNNDIALAPLPRPWTTTNSAAAQLRNGPLTDEHAPSHSGLVATTDLAHNRQVASLVSLSGVPSPACGNSYQNSNPASYQNSNPATHNLYGSVYRFQPATTISYDMPDNANEQYCPDCSIGFRSTSSLQRHNARYHQPRNFICCFSFAGCKARFDNKYTWKRHMKLQHICLESYECLVCLQKTGKSPKIIRKHNVAKHLHHEHRIDRQSPDNYVRSCSTQPPQHLRCSSQNCSREFHGRDAWTLWTEHIGQHMSQSQEIGVEDLLIKYSEDNGIICQVDGQWQLLDLKTKKGQSNDGSLGQFQAQYIFSRQIELKKLHN
ncbi:C2H2 finger domain protein, putative [Beauveria bassiana ARSEF 2860]|uniref:C2H2 finger domain protein, putative n=1 Tax=Beauveria bassiana (strain ARSEF 2860) TaxID=655819 RepID=J4KL51_BEAB2|nr:C2H2 finger domain protein, putative [Beauveria bassiana ARSEF 2860]EJP61594.1 C2H2 finger domain protein, putative [Beauveria bassiana ARSEF 2860]